MSNKDLKLFDDQKAVQAPEDPAPIFQEPESKTFTPLFDPSPLSSPPQQPEQPASQTGLFAQEALNPLPTNTVTRDQSTTLFHQAPMADPPPPKFQQRLGLHSTFPATRWLNKHSEIFCNRSPILRARKTLSGSSWMAFSL